MLDFSPQSLVITAISALGFYGAFRFFKSRLKVDGESVNWTPLEAVSVTVAIYFVSQIIPALGLGVYASIRGLNETELSNSVEGPLPQFLYVLCVEVIVVWLLYAFMKRRATPWKSIGFVKPRFRDLGYILSGFGGYFILYALILLPLIEKYSSIDTEQRQQLGFETSVAGPELVFVFLSLVILPPLVEEILVRGFLFTGLKNRLGIWNAAIITSIVFAVAHLQWGSDAPLLWSAAIDTFVLSLFLVYVRYRSGSLWPSIGIHFIKNGLAFLALFVFKVV